MLNEETAIMKFSHRNGLTEKKFAFQIDSMDDALKTRLWNVMFEHFFVKLENVSFGSNKKNQQVIALIWNDFFVDTIDKIAGYYGINEDKFLELFKEWYCKAPYYEVYDFIEFIIPVIEETTKGKINLFIDACNKALEKEGSVYRIVDRIVIRIIANTELQEIEQAVEGKTADDPVVFHFSRALALLTDRKTPYYRRAVLEAITAVDAMLQNYPFHTITHNELSPTTVCISNIDGVKRALEDETLPVSFNEAKYWVVFCAAFMNYLKYSAA